jgi:hypothetical protein
MLHDGWMNADRSVETTRAARRVGAFATLSTPEAPRSAAWRAHRKAASSGGGARGLVLAEATSPYLVGS